MAEKMDVQGEHRGGWLQWLASGLGLVLAVGVTGYILWDGITAADSPPAVRVEAVRVLASPPGYTLEIRARNLGGSTAASVLVEGSLSRQGRTVESSEITFDYVPGHSDRTGGLYFTQDPRAFDLSLRPHGYVRP